MSSEYVSHLCTFMGREANLRVLLPYIETCLRVEANDNYWFIDMTLQRSDHEYIKQMSQEMNEKFPGRVHLYNSDERSTIIDDPEIIKTVSNDWSVFYKFLRKFNDNDIIAKCDDDTYYIDVETLKGAFDYRWNNKRPYIMHANAINNGVAAYHQSKKKIWDGDEEKLYPIGGLTGPLFAHPEIACKHHDAFATDMLQDRNNINKYKLGKNIHFTNRVSINFFFMLGSDRNSLSKITRQDEYDTSCKYPQIEDRPNMLIGDFTMAHHTYGVQEPVMERLETDIKYKKLSKKLNSEDNVYEHKPITDKYTPTSTIKSGDEYVARAWVEKNSYCLRDPKTRLYISTQNVVANNPNGNFLKTRWDSTTDLKQACVFNIDVNDENCMWINNSIQIIRHPDKDKDQEAAGMGYTFFQGLYTKSKMTVSKDNDKIVISPSGKSDYTLAPAILNDNVPMDDKRRSLLFWTRKARFEWDLVPVNQYNDRVVSMNIIRPDKWMQYTNDETRGESKIDDLPNNNAPRDYIWMIKDYIWEFNKVDDNKYQIKLVADDKEDLFLGKLGKTNIVGTIEEPEKWVIDDDKLRHDPSGKELFVDDTGEIQLKDSGSSLDINIQ